MPVLKEKEPKKIKNLYKIFSGLRGSQKTI
jgi:hypothetical protein